MKWNIEADSIKDTGYTKWLGDYEGAKAQMRLRTHHHELYGYIAKNKSIHEARGKQGKVFSEGSSQYILRKALADTIQRVPDGELQTQYDKGSVEHILTQYLFENKVLSSEIEGCDMLSNLTSTFKSGFTYAFAAVRTGFENDLDNDARISYTVENWADIFPNRDCKDIRRPQVLWFRSYMSKADVEALITEEGTLRDSSYNADAVKHVLDNDLFKGKQPESEALADQMKGSSSLQSIELLTKYVRGESEFVTYVPELQAKWRTVKNYDPRKGIPWHFLVLEVDSDFPIGISQFEYLLADQQFQDLFQTSAFKNLLLAMEPPIMVGGWETNPMAYRFEPRKIWSLGNNPNQTKVEPVKIGNEVLTGFLPTREGVAAGMLRQLNVLDGTIARDSGVPGFSATPQGVEAQTTSKQISINQYQKRVEYFFSEWANAALRTYINSMTGVHELTVDEATRRRLFDLGDEGMELIVGDKVKVDFDKLSTDMLQFKVRTGSLVEKKEEQERKALQETVQPFVQNLTGWSEENKKVIENEVLLPAAKRMLELSDTDIGQSTAESIGSHMAKMMLAEMQGQIDGLAAQNEMQGAQIDATQKALPPESQAQLAQELPPVSMEEGAPAPEIPTPGLGAGGASPSRPPVPEPGPVPAGQEVISPAELLEL
jgi:hypothetical protein